MSESKTNIVIFCLQGAGNAFLSLPLAEALKIRWPEAKTTLLLTSGRVGDVCIEHAGVDQVLLTGKSRLSLLGRLRKERFDLAVFAFPAGFRSHLLAWAAGIPSRTGHRIPGRRSFALTTEVAVLDQAHDLEQNRQLAQALGASLNPETLWPPLAPICAHAVERARRYLTEAGLDPDARYLGIHPGSDSRFVEKRYPPERFAQVAEAIHEKFGLSAIVFDGPAEPGTGKQIVRAAQTPVHPLDGWGDLVDAWGLISVCDLFVSNDSGLMNLAEASGVPTVAVFGPSQMHRTRPFLGRAVKSDWDCSPCYSLSRYPGCPSREGSCLDDLDPALVIEAAQKVLAR